MRVVVLDLLPVNEGKLSLVIRTVNKAQQLYREAKAEREVLSNKGKQVVKSICGRLLKTRILLVAESISFSFSFFHAFLCG